MIGIFRKFYLIKYLYRSCCNSLDQFQFIVHPGLRFFESNVLLLSFSNVFPTMFILHMFKYIRIFMFMII